VDARLLLTGLSASASFVNRFAMIHTEDVIAVACVSKGGWPIAPVKRLGRIPLDYRVRIHDVAELVGHSPSPEALKDVRWFFLLGDKDDNDAVPHRDSFSAADQARIFRRSGTTPVSRWKAAEKLYSDAGLHARFQLYPDVGQVVTPPCARTS
jgi:hypothetical protein